MTSTTIDRIHAVSISASHDDETVHIGKPAAVNHPRSRRPINLPNRLDAAGCLAILEQLDPELSELKGKIEAGQASITADYVDELLEYSEFNLEQKFLFKSQLSECGLLPRGRRLAR
jgi:hypothetical protein